jgi:2',3'-cyclic-nucleotide 2'-phosphodiesterase (5'-nucleotidase family)
MQYGWLAIVILVLTACGGGSGSEADSGAGNSAGGGGNTSSQTRTLRFIHYNDLHANLTEHVDLRRDGDGSATLVKRGGIARLATKIQQLRSEQALNITMNIGDTYHGGVEALYSDGNAIVPAVNAIGFDVGVPGNWDWAYGPDVTRLRFKGEIGNGCPKVSALGRMYGVPNIAKPNFPHLGGNVVYDQPSSLAGQPFLPATMMLDRSGIKVGLIGITSDIVPRMHEMMAACLNFLQGENNYRDFVERHARDLRAQGAQVVVVMSELGIHKDWRLANVIAPALVDVFFSAHTHEATFEPLKGSSGALVVEAGSDVYVGSLDIVFDGAGQIVSKTWSLHTIDNSIAEDQNVKQLVAEARAPFLQNQPNLSLREAFGGHTLTQSISTVIGHSDVLLSRRHALDNSFNRAFTAAQRSVLGTDVALAPGFRFDAVIAPAGSAVENDSIASGAITLEDAYRFFPAPSTLGVGQIGADNLKNLIEGNLTAVFSKDLFSQNGGWTDGFAGIKVQVDLSAPDGQRIQSLQHSDGRVIQEGELLRVAGCRRPNDGDDTLCSYPLFSAVHDSLDPVSGQNWYVTDFLQYALQNGHWPQTTAPVFNDVSSTAQWPQSPFYQPLEGAP